MTTPTTVSVRLQLRADTAANWTSANPTLLANELGRETDTGKIKIGDGSTAWSSLAYQAWATLPIAVASGGTGQTSYTNGQLLIGNTTGNTLTKATLTAGSGIAITNGTGSITVAASGISDAQIAADAEIAVSKLADGTARQLLQTDAAGTGVEWASNIDIPGTLDVTSAATFDSTIGASAGTASLPSITFTGDLNTGIYSPGADQVAISTNGTNRFQIDSSGNITVDTNTFYVDAANNRVGVGTTTPGSSLTIVADSNSNGIDIIGRSSDNQSRMRFTNNAYNSVYGQITHDATNLSINNALSGAVVLSSSNTERLRITSGGLVGIGTSSPQANLHVETVGNPEILIGGTQTPIFSLVGGNGTDPVVGFAKGSLRIGTVTGAAGAGFSEKVRIDTSGNVGIGTSPTSKLDVVDTAADPVLSIRAGSTFSPSIYLEASGTNAGAIKYDRATQALTFSNNSASTERARIDSSGRLLVGTSTARANFFNSTNTTPFQIEGTSSNSAGISVVSNPGATAGGTSVVVLGKSRGSSVGSTTLVASGDELGVLSFQGADGTEFVEGARISSEVDGTPGANDMPGRLVFSTTADGASSPTERMRIGNDGITRLFVTNNDGFQSRSSGAAGTTLAVYVGLHSATSTTTGNISYVVWNNGNVVNANNSYGSLSDLKLKENIVDATSQWSDIKALQVRKYNFKEGQTHTQIGLIAQEVELVSPGLVTESPDRDAEGNDLGTVTKSVNYSVLYMKAVKALQEAMERIEQLEAKVAALEAA